MAVSKSDNYYVDVPDGISRQRMMAIVDRAAAEAGLYVSHIGSYSRRKYPNSVHWHFKRDAREPGLLDATFWDVKSLLWLMIRHREPQWVKDMVPTLLAALERQLHAK